MHGRYIFDFCKSTRESTPVVSTSTSHIGQHPTAARRFGGQTRVETLGNSFARREDVLNLTRFQCVLAVLVGVSSIFAYQGGRAGKETLAPGDNILWLDPGNPSTRDFVYGVGGPENRPQPPFRFLN